MQLKIEYMPVDDLIPYAGNAKEHSAEQIEQIKKSIEEFGMNDPIGIWNNNEIIEGHGRLIACKELGITPVPVVRLDHLTDEQRRAYALVHNKLTMNTDFIPDLLELELNDIADIDMSQYGFDLDLEEVDSYAFDKKYANNLQKHFGVPPFSVLDARQGYWQERKREWLKLTGDLSETRDGEYGRISDGMITAINEGTSNFDPVLAEVMYKWFCIDGGKILDPFGGEQTKGVVAGELGYKYIACEIRQDQVDLNNEKTEPYDNVMYYCGDSSEISDIIPDREFDMCFTSPPYYDLEVYSDDDLSSLGTYDEFMALYRRIFEQCYDMMRDNTFLVIKVGEIRDKSTGNYRGFVSDNINLFKEIGFAYYNEIILVNPAGTAPLRANSNMVSRKVVKTHQNVLVFYKGDTKKIKDYFPQLNFDEEDGS